MKILRTFFSHIETILNTNQSLERFLTLETLLKNFEINGKETQILINRDLIKINKLGINFRRIHLNDFPTVCLIGEKGIVGKVGAIALHPDLKLQKDDDTNVFFLVAKYDNYETRWPFLTLESRNLYYEIMEEIFALVHKIN